MKKLFATCLLAAAFVVPAVFAQDAAQAQQQDTQAAQTQSSDAAAPAQGATTPAANQKFAARMIQRRVAKMTAVLSLTPAQQTQVTSILTNSLAANFGTRGQMKSARAAMRTAIQSNDTATIEQASNTIGTIAAQNAAARAKTAAAIYQILTPAQQAKAQQLADLFGGRARRNRA